MPTTRPDPRLARSMEPYILDRYLEVKAQMHHHMLDYEDEKFEHHHHQRQSEQKSRIIARLEAENAVASEWLQLLTSMGGPLLQRALIPGQVNVDQQLAADLADLQVLLTSDKSQPPGSHEEWQVRSAHVRACAAAITGTAACLSCAPSSSKRTISSLSAANHWQQGSIIAAAAVEEVLVAALQQGIDALKARRQQQAATTSAPAAQQDPLASSCADGTTPRAASSPSSPQLRRTSGKLHASASGTSTPSAALGEVPEVPEAPKEDEDGCMVHIRLARPGCAGSSCEAAAEAPRDSGKPAFDEATDTVLAAALAGLSPRRRTRARTLTTPRATADDLPAAPQQAGSSSAHTSAAAGAALHLPLHSSGTSPRMCHATADDVLDHQQASSRQGRWPLAALAEAAGTDSDAGSPPASPRRRTWAFHSLRISLPSHEDPFGGAAADSSPAAGSPRPSQYSPRSPCSPRLADSLRNAFRRVTAGTAWPHQQGDASAAEHAAWADVDDGSGGGGAGQRGADGRIRPRVVVPGCSHRACVCGSCLAVKLYDGCPGCQGSLGGTGSHLASRHKARYVVGTRYMAVQQQA